MKRALAVGMLLVVLGLGVAIAGEKAKKLEIEDVSVAEKIKWAKATRVPLMDALRTALSHTPGQAIEAELESIDGRLVYEIEIVTAEGKVIESYVDPQTGKLIDSGGKP
jgi:uncharacterized membrane protein YkoI